MTFWLVRIYYMKTYSFFINNYKQNFLQSRKEIILLELFKYQFFFVYGKF